MTVNSLADNTTSGDGFCTLREALENANSLAAVAPHPDCPKGDAHPTLDTITFSVSGTIMISQGALQISQAAGFDQGGVRIDGGGNITLQRSSGSHPGFVIGRTGATTSDVTIEGLEITGFTGHGISATNGDGIRILDNVIHDNGGAGVRVAGQNTDDFIIRGNTIGLDASGNPSGNVDGIRVPTGGAPGLTIDDNIISGNSSEGIDIQGGVAGTMTGLVITDNLIGTNSSGDACDTGGSGTNVFGNGRNGILMRGGVTDMLIRGNTIGCNGRTQTAGSNHGDGISIGNGVDGGDIDQNYIGGTATDNPSVGTDDISNLHNGIDIRGADNITISGNLIGNNGHNSGANNDGIRIRRNGTRAIKITQNSIYNNGLSTSTNGLGIDIGANGVNTNDATAGNEDNDGGPNLRMNYPEITVVVNTGSALGVTFSVPTATSNHTYPLTIEFFVADAGGEGQTYVGSTTYTAADATMSVTRIITPVVPVGVGDRIVATATDVDCNTSEFTLNPMPTPATIGQVSLDVTPTDEFAEELGLDRLDATGLYALLDQWAPDADHLDDLTREALLAALFDYLDPEADGQVAVLRWDTLEERGTIGFYVERRIADSGDWTLVTNDILPGLVTAPLGGEYMLADPGATPGEVYQYRLVELEATGARRFHGPYRLELPSGK